VTSTFELTAGRLFGGGLAFEASEGSVLSTHTAISRFPRFSMTPGRSLKGLAAVLVNGGWGYIDHTGEIVINVQ